MFGLGLFEFILIFIAIIIFIKPEDLPSFLNKIGRIYGQLKVNYEYFFRSLRKTEYDIKEHLQESLSFKEQTKPAIKEKQTKKKQTLSNKTQTKKKNKQKKNLKDLN